MKVMVTGATGLIGVPLVQKLAETGVTVHAFCRSESKAKVFDHPNIEIFIGDLSDPESIEKAVIGCEQVYHLAAFARVWHKRRSYFHEVNVDHTIQLAETAFKAGVKKIVFTSTAGVLGPSQEQTVDETSEKTGNFFTPYEESKFLAEQAMQKLSNHDRQVVIVNPSRLYGPGPLIESNSVTPAAAAICKRQMEVPARKWKIERQLCLH
jgi:nucleoside-diphosphate-sugar epimerase